MATDVVGSWFPSGYHGHFRNRSRTTVTNEFRQKARPTPPEVFSRRFREIRLRNPFTSHDNKSALILDATGFGQGVGKKRIETPCASRYQPDFFTWAGERSVNQGYISVNQTTYNGGSPSPSRKVFMPESQSGDNTSSAKLDSTYRLSYGTRPLNSRFHFTPAATSQVKPMELPPMTARQLNPKQPELKLAKMRTRSAPPKSSSVQDCLTWFDMVKPKTDSGNSEDATITTTTTIAPLELGSSQIES
ncbi:uncharacterized protein LOC142336784 [Convolutriloba macropyga]|uniref:uncharacterized protein LOC142336784 n=1 Tax=Convolutriloba macropyga TaxID=536237 RepID=UPI003F526EF1